MGRYDAAKAAAQWRSSGDDADIFAGAPGVHIVLRNRSGNEQNLMQGTWNEPPPILVTTAGFDRYWKRALQLWDRTWLFIEEQPA